jgi:hypothetical protein
MSDDNEETDEAIQEAMEASLHVHMIGGNDLNACDDVDVSIGNGNVVVSAKLSRDEIDVLVMALRTKLEFVSVRAGEATITVSSDWTDEDERSPEFDDLATIGIAFRGSDPILAIRDRESLIVLLRDGCSAMGLPARASERPGASKCN